MALKKAQLNACADWHANKAMNAYRKGDYDTYFRHIQKCDSLRKQADAGG